MLNLFDWHLIFTNIPKLLEYLPTTLEVAFVAYFFSIVIGLLVAVVRSRKPRILYPIVSFYVSLTRGTPVLVQLYATYFGIPMILSVILFLSTLSQTWYLRWLRCL